MRHGFNSVSRHNPVYARDIEEIARKLCGADQDPQLYEYALVIAECDLLLSRIRAYSTALAVRVKDPNAFPTTKWRSELKRHSDGIYERMERSEAVEECYPEAGQPEKFGPEELDRRWADYWRYEEDRDDCGAALMALPDLKRVSRYERRAWSRRRRAFQEFLRVKAMNA